MNKYITAAISVAPVPMFFIGISAAESASNIFFTVIAVVTWSYLFYFVFVLFWISGKAQAAWREILGGDSEGD